MNWKKWISIAAAVCLAVTAVPMRAVAQEELVQEKVLEEIKEELKEEPKEEKEELQEEKEEQQEELKEELKEEKEEKEKLQEKSAEKTEPQEESKKELLKGISLLMEEENSTAVSGNETADFEGEGTATNPYEIRNAEDLKKLAENVKNGTDYEGKYFKQTADIDLEDKEWTPIGTKVYTGEFGRSETRHFKGTFDGDGHQIANLTITGRNEYVGLFGYVRNATIQNCNVAGEVSGYNFVGGIVGAVDGKTNNILNCSFQGNVTGNMYVGGIVGQVQNQCEVSSCYAIGTVHGGNDKVGGIAGEGRGAIKNCYVLADVSASGKFAGGITGDTYNLAIENCYYSGMVSASGSAGGIVGNTWGGGIENCVSLAKSVTGSNANRIAGGNPNATLTDNYAWDGTTVSSSAASDGEDLTYENGTLSKQFSAIFDNTDSAWKFTEDGLPILKDVGGTQFSELPKCMTGVGFDGFGIKTNPYLIEDVEDLKLLAEKVNSGVTYANTYFKQTADINLNDTAWTPIGGTVIEHPSTWEISVFKGNFDGDGHRITITGDSDFGGLFGSVEEAIIQNCHVVGDVKGYYSVGGIVGGAGGKTQILNCSFRGNVTGTGSCIGGIVGDTSFGCEVSGCFVTGKVEGLQKVGGIAGKGIGTIKNCYALADVTAKSDFSPNTNEAGNYAGGIAGDVFYCTIENCYYSGKVSVSDYAGGIAGYVYGGDNAPTTIKNCVSLAESVTGGSYVNRITGGVEVYGNEKVVTLTNNYSYNRTKLVVGDNTTYADDTDPKAGTNVFVSAGKLMTDVPNQTLFDWVANGFTEENGWSISERTGLPYLREDFSPNLPEEPVPTKKRSGGGGTATQTYTAQFDTNGGSAVVEIKTDKNGKIEKPADPTKEGYIFVGWYSDSKLTKPFDFSAELTANSTLYAKWKENNEIILTIGSQKISVFGREIQNDVAPKIVNDRTMLPIRIVAESLGGTVTWNGELQRVTIQKGADVILITIGADTAYVNGTAVKLDAAAFVENGRTYLPLRFISETLGAQVAWNEAEKTVTITK